MRIMTLLCAATFSLAACGSHTTPPSNEPLLPYPPPEAPPDPQLSPSAPHDRPMAVPAGAVSPLEQMLAPCIAKARAAYPDAEQRFEHGLPSNQSLFAVTALHDTLGHFERVFIAVDSIKSHEIYGRIWNQINLVQGYHLKQPYQFPDSELLDWMISKPDGSEEGNWSGKFMDAFQATGRPPTGVC